MVQQSNERTSLIYDEHRGYAKSYGAASNVHNINTGVNFTQRTKPPRIIALDVFRGLVMVLQSLDHARLFLTNNKSQAKYETWYIQPVYKDLIPSMARLVTHLAAPGFAFMMGFGIILFSKSRLRIGWNESKLLNHYIIRGLVLILLNTYLTICEFYYFNSMGYLTNVLFALGVNFIIGGLIFLAGIKSFPYIVKFYQPESSSNNPIIDHKIAENKTKNTRNIVFLIIVILLAVGNVLQTPNSKEYGVVDFGWWRHFWLLPGNYKFIISIYPPLNWLSFTIYGIFYGHIALKQVHNKRFNRNLNVKIGISLLALFLAIRIPGKFGNINPDLLPSPPPGTLFNNPYLTSALQFVNAIKYPPDLSFFTLYMGLNHLILAGFYSIPSFTSYSTLNYFIDFINSGPLLAFGQSALFFYVIHFHLCCFMALIVTYNQETLYNIDSWQFWSWWIFGLALLWPICVRYAKFKSCKDPNSLWRFF